MYHLFCTLTLTYMALEGDISLSLLRPCLASQEQRRWRQPEPEPEAEHLEGQPRGAHLPLALLLAITLSRTLALLLALPHRTSDGGSLSLSTLKGSPVVLFFYPKAATPGCTKEVRTAIVILAPFSCVRSLKRCTGSVFSIGSRRPGWHVALIEGREGGGS